MKMGKDFHTIQSILKHMYWKLAEELTKAFPYYSVYFKAIEGAGSLVHVDFISILFSLF